MRVDIILVLGMALLLASVGAETARAAECQIESPNLQASRSVWTPVPIDTDAVQLRDRVLAFLGKLDGHWQGAGGTTACIRSRASAVPVRAPERIHLSVKRTGDASFDFHFSIYDRHNNVSTAYNFVLAQHDKTLQVTGEGDIGIIRFYNGAIRFRTQTAMRTGFRRKLGKGTAHTVLSLETVRQFVLNHDELSFYKAVFHNGAMIEYSHWRFQRSS